MSWIEQLKILDKICEIIDKLDKIEELIKKIDPNSGKNLRKRGKKNIREVSQK